ncbi:Phosphatidylinositol (PI) 3-kinase [Lobosporangium transversale]|uniref:Phosphatidylinositol 3-kinase VPS34 n=1 Tax=Lobosporangium transversale TaxID=64571 RepID=A0A1Y2GHR8_9FUNG|nr:putative atypical/PIKK/PI3K protein kinase [Lobosporangium transversale]KAF9917734.1 Phosphatidylinositol (PI) 3-kinase [Lobosporangium transversale]ORZ10034.1 putative atypical/PIKK/PI3K protein kinase [Lobosporangium transversale]|eukprot:XP_021879124.1 putative atypical/PIKK/PI3K protein kinase [Lobosporangium transversale]
MNIQRDIGGEKFKNYKDYSYCLSGKLDLNLRVRISLLEWKPKRPHLDASTVPYSAEKRSPYPDLYVTCQVFAGDQPLTIVLKTSYKPMSSKFTWNEWIVLPIKYKDLPLNAQLAFTVWDAASPRKVVAVGGSTLRLFGPFNIIRTGPQKLYMWPDCEADGSEHTKTPSDTGERTEMDRYEKLLKKQDRGDIPRTDWLDNLAYRQIEQIHKKLAAQSDKMLLNVDLPRFDFPVIFDEHEYEFKPHPISNSFGGPAAAGSTPLVHGNSSSGNPIFTVEDPEMTRENPVEAKHRRMVRSHRNTPLDRELKPNPKIRDELAQILRYPPSHSLTAAEKDQLWEFRFYLTRDKRALTKFLKSVVWSDPAEAKQAVDLLPTWVGVDVDDALELLGSSFENREVRSYAVTQLRSANDDDLLLFLLQLVQGLKFEQIDDNFGESNLAAFLIERAVKNPILGNYFHWYLMIECEDVAVSKMYGKVVYQYMSMMAASGIQRRESLRRQGELIQTLANLAKSIKQMRESRPKKIEKLREFISDPKNGLISFLPLALPLDPRVEVTGIIPEKTSIFKSNLLPLHLTFSCTDGSQYQAIFKSGDDLRQDQLVIQLITLMDDLLRKENLDLKLMPYKVLATGADHGMVQFVPSQSLANVLNENNGSLLMFWRKYHLDERSVDTFGVRPEVMDAYVKSCAGYCVIMYLLGVGDRHLDNLLLSPNGNIFHVDFGFILGRDPKPFPAPMKITKEMVDAMGGFNSVHYQSFKSYCFTAYNILRKSANLILNLFGLMVDANIPDIKAEPDKAVWKVEERFQLNLTDDEAIKFFQNLINESVGALIPQIAETIHGWAQHWRK